MMMPETGMSGRCPNANVHIGRIAGAMGRTQPDHGIGIDLRQARVKTATGSLTSTH